MAATFYRVVTDEPNLIDALINNYSLFFLEQLLLDCPHKLHPVESLLSCSNEPPHDPVIGLLANTVPTERPKTAIAKKRQLRRNSIILINQISL